MRGTKVSRLATEPNNCLLSSANNCTAESNIVDITDAIVSSVDENSDSLEKIKHFVCLSCYIRPNHQ